MPLSHCVRSLEAWLGPMDVQGLRCGRRHRNWPNRTSCGLPTTDLVLSVVDFTDRAVGTDSKSRSRNYPRLPRESVSVYPHEMSLKPRCGCSNYPRLFRESTSIYPHEISLKPGEGLRAKHAVYAVMTMLLLALSSTAKSLHFNTKSRCETCGVTFFNQITAISRTIPRIV